MTFTLLGSARRMAEQRLQASVKAFESNLLRRGVRTMRAAFAPPRTVTWQITKN